MRIRYWMNRLALVLLALPALGVLASAYLGRGVPTRGGAGALQGPIYGLLVSTGTWVVAWQHIRRQEERARAAQRPSAASLER
jgi:hypothetical protein